MIKNMIGPTIYLKKINSIIAKIYLNTINNWQTNARKTKSNNKKLQKTEKKVFETILIDIKNDLKD